MPNNCFFYLWIFTLFLPIEFKYYPRSRSQACKFLPRVRGFQIYTKKTETWTRDYLPTAGQQLIAMHLPNHIRTSYSKHSSASRTVTHHEIMWSFLLALYTPKVTVVVASRDLPLMSCLVLYSRSELLECGTAERV